MSTEPLHGHPLDFDAVVLDFDEIAVAEDALKPGGDLPWPVSRRGSPRLSREQRPAELAGDAAAEADQALAVGCQHLLVDARPEIKALQKGLRGELDQVLKALRSLASSVRW